MKRISRSKLEKFGVKHFVPKKGFAKYAIDTWTDNKSLRIFYRFNFWAKVLTIILFPINLLIVGVGNFYEIKDDFKDVWNIKKDWYPGDVILAGSGTLYNYLSEWYWSK